MVALRPAKSEIAKRVGALKGSATAHILGRTLHTGEPIPAKDLDDLTFDVEMDVYGKFTDLAQLIVRGIGRDRGISYDEAHGIAWHTKALHEMIGSGLPENAEGFTDDVGFKLGGRRTTILDLLRRATAGTVPLLAG